MFNDQRDDNDDDGSISAADDDGSIKKLQLLVKHTRI